MPARSTTRSPNLKLLAGEQKSRVNTDVPQPSDGRPVCPTSDPLIQEVWDYTLDQLDEMGLTSVCDRDVLHAYCAAVAVHRKAEELVAREGYFIKILNSTQPHPALKVMREQAPLIKSLGNEFGMSPAARTRIHVQPKPKKAAGRDSGRLLSG
jgi:P27 family predicted phage terminase small subunit